MRDDNESVGQVAPVATIQPSWMAYTPVWVVSALLVAVLVAAGGVVSTIYTHDLYVVFDGGWRTFIGQRPYVNFHTPVGFAYFLPYLLLRAVEPFSLSTLLHANAVVAVGLLILSTWALPRRLSPPLFFVAALAIFTVVISPRAADFPASIFSHLAPYNRWSEGAMMLMAGVLLLRPKAAFTSGSGRFAPGAEIAAAVTLAVLGLFLFHLKITYFICSLLLVLVGLGTRQVSWRTIVWAVGLFVLGSVVIEATLHLHKPYWDDLQMARHATLEQSDDGIKVVNKRWGLYWFSGYFVAIAALVLLAQGTGGGLKPTMRRWRTLLAIVISGLIIGVLANTQTHMQFEVPLMAIVLLVAAELIGRAIPIGSLPIGRRLLMGVVVLVFAGTGSAFESMAVVEHTRVSRDGSTCPIPASIGTPGAQLLFSKSTLSDVPDAATRRCDQLAVDPSTLRIAKPFDFVLFDSARVEVGRLSEGQSMLRAHLRPGQRVIAMDFANPYPAFTATMPTNDSLLWWDFGRTYSTSFHPDAGQLLKEADFVLESRWDPFWEPHGENMWSLYKPEVLPNFRMIKDGRFWRLWQRKPG